MSDRVFGKYKQAHARAVTHWNIKLDEALSMTFEAYTNSARLARDKFNDPKRSNEENRERLRTAAIVEVMMG